ncbi:translocation/assembly module TamB domain-containing protein [Wenzhouxiangella sp. XN24]|uniref:translocation/assembly module TamB domain-containing protein n=1 Tax=Wenzhouxiangella sp. XN24 TaxID=2713569 RepID=UPI0013EAD2E0|nr:hypothetical protein [Wenzhouxiangella sp. XN24]
MKRRGFKATLIVLAAGLAIACGAAAWLLGTTAGLRFAAARALPYLPVILEPDELEGRLAGPLSTGPIEVATAGVSGTLDRVMLDWRPLALLHGTLHVLELRVQRPEFVLTSTEAGSRAADDGPAASLPLAIRIDRLVLREGMLRSGDETLVADLDLELSGRAGGREFDIESLTLDSSRGTAAGHARISLADDEPWDIDLDWQLALDDTALAGRTRATGNMSELAFSQVFSEPLAAQIDGTVHELGNTPRWELDLAIDPLAERGPWPESLHAAAAALRIEGTLEDSTIDGRLDAPGLWPNTMMVAANVGWSSARLQVRSVTLELGDEGRLVADGQWTPDDPSATEFTLQGQALAWPPAASDKTFRIPRLELRGEGQAGEWSLRGEALARRAGLPDIEIGTAMTWDGEMLIVEQLTVDSPDDEIRGHASGRLLTNGAGLSYRAAAELAVALPDYPPAELSLAVTGDAGGLELEPLDIEVLDGRIRGAGRIAWSDEVASDFRLAFTELNPASLAADWPGRVSGELALAGLPAAPDGLAIELDALRGTLRGLPVDGRAEVTIDTDGFVLRPSRLSVGGNKVSASGRLEDRTVSLDASLDASRLSELIDTAAGRLQGSLRISGPRAEPETVLELQGSGLGWGTGADADLAVNLRLDGSYGARRWTGRIDTLAVAQAGRPAWRLEDPAALTLAPDQVALDEACLDGPPGRACLDLDWARAGEWKSRATISALQLASLDRWLGAGLQMAGTVNGQLDLAGDGREFRRLGGRLEITPGSITQAGADDTRDTLLAWRDGILQLDGDPAAAQATLDLDLKSDDRLDGRLAIAWNEPDPALDGELNIAFSQLDIITEFVPDLSGLEGQAEASAALTGSIAAPQLTGRFAWRDGSVQIPTLGIRPDDIEVVARLAKSELVFDASGRSGEGEFRAEGRFELGADTIEGVATLEGERLLVMDLPEMRVAASPDLRFRYLPDRINIGGELTIPFARITGFGGSGAVTTSPDEVIISEDGEEKGQELVIASRIRVDVGPDVRLDVAGLRGAVEGEIIAATEPESLPWGRGELRVVDGNFRAFGQQLEIETGRLIYTGGPLENPGLDIRAIREVRDVTAGALIRGTLERPELSIFSDPPMPRAEALSYLTLGKGMDELQAGEQRTLNQAASSLALSGGGLIARDLGRRLGLDEVSVSAANGAEGAALVLGKHLGGGLYVSYGLGLFDAVNTLRLRYQITRRLSIEAVSGDQAEADLFYTFERD